MESKTKTPEERARLRDELIQIYEERLLNALKRKGITAEVVPHGIAVSCGFDRWLIDVRGNVKVETNQAHVILYHQNIIDKTLKCTHKRKGWGAMPDMHVQFSKADCRIRDLVRYIYTHAGRYSRL